MNDTPHHDPYWQFIARRFRRKRLGVVALYVFILFCAVAVFAPFLASSKPIVVRYDGTWYFPLFRYLFFSGFYTKNLDIFFNILIFIVPLIGLAYLFKASKAVFTLLGVLPFILFVYLQFNPVKDPASDQFLAQAHQAALKTSSQKEINSWPFELKYMNKYARLNLVVQQILRQQFNQRMEPYAEAYSKALEHRLNKPGPFPLPTLWQQQLDYENTVKDPQFFIDRRAWIEAQEKKINFMLMSLLSHFHWEDDAGGDDLLNQLVPWWDLTRINRKDMVSALIFGTRISLVVGITSVLLALLIGIPIGAFAGYYGGTSDIVVSRLLEIWEAMPTFFMLLMVVAITQSKTVFLVIAVIGLFGWTGFSRYVRGEFFKQRNLAYVEACRAQGFNDRYIMFSHLLPNAIPPVLTLLPFAVMGAITTEAGLSFLGLGEEGSCSWGVLMDEGRIAFPGEAYLLWPPAIVLTVLLIAIALIGDSLRDALDPKL